MSHCHDDDAPGFNLVHDTERIPPEQIPACPVFERCPCVRLFRDSQFRSVEFSIEAESSSGTPLGVPASARLGFFESLGEILKVARHLGQPVEYVGGPQPKKPFAPARC